jgi:hypothetical protein
MSMLLASGYPSSGPDTLIWINDWEAGIDAPPANLVAIMDPCLGWAGAAHARSFRQAVVHRFLTMWPRTRLAAARLIGIKAWCDKRSGKTSRIY